MWPSLCEALRTNFQQHKTAFEIKEMVRSRKQGQNESFDDFRNAVLKLAEPLQSLFSELELMEILQHNLRPRIRQQLLYVQINSLAELRRLCLKSESLVNEINRSTNALPNVNPRPQSRRYVNEVQDENDLAESIGIEPEVDEISKLSAEAKQICWNCRREGHRYFDCFEIRTVFCYGCGAPEVYRPKSSRCNPENLKESEVPRNNPRDDLKP
ncbi:uncharacterized protein LOC118757134 [Rhagoletis pomonella]|uniref:uncharacterized protein LOC118757134 n=1 Tax=Rhagoletis pomonella TaxID=28610 RepID=UPI0017856B55|nr:uncharacterized protein LOC118757134 [Rhagoletis pomonella]